MAKFSAIVAALCLAPAAVAFSGLRASTWTTKGRTSSKASTLSMKLGDKDDPIVLIGVAADSGCGKSTFMRRLVQNFGGGNVGPLGGGFPESWETNTLVSDDVTVICLDDYHLNDRAGRKVTGLTALDAAENNFDLMYEQLAALKSGSEISKPIYNHVNGTLDTPETIVPTPIVIIEGLHPMYDKRVRELLDFSIYLDISDEIKFAWKIQRDMVERGHSKESILASIEARKPDFDAFVGPQRADSDLVISVLPTELVDDPEAKTLRVKLIQREGVDNFDPVYLFDEGSTIEWIPCGKKLTCSYPGIKFKYGPDTYFDKEVSVLEMDGKFDNLQELIYVESHLSNTGSKFYGELTQQMLKLSDSPGSDNGTGFFQTLSALKLREIYEKITKKTVEASKL
mmetsp:Transcript_13552/g.32093  ORF Transcript_13552/g.32093 Transcript_13552/m.32093 type:complete len:398 (-) Transcript_13552:390-1583(-)